MKAFQPPNGQASAARHRPDRQPSKLMLNFGSWAGRLHAVLGGFYLVYIYPTALNRGRLRCCPTSAYFDLRSSSIVV